MTLKNKGKKIIPPRFRPIARSLYCLMIMPHYYFHYLFGKGKAKYPLRAKFELNYHGAQKSLTCHPTTEEFPQTSPRPERQETEKELTAAELLRVIDDLTSMGVREITIRADEPFLRKDLFDIIARIKENRVDCTIMSTDTLLDESQARKLVQYRVDNLILSLDGNQQTHNSIHHNVPDSYQKLMSSLRFISEARKLSGNGCPTLLLSCMVSAINAGQLSELMDIAHQYGAGMHYGYLHYTTDKMLQRTSAVIDTENTENESNDVYEKLRLINVEELKKELGNIEKKQREYNIEANFQPPLKGDEIERHYFDDQFAFASKCFYPWYSLRIYPCGEVHPCAMDACVGNVRDASIKDIWNNAKFGSPYKAMQVIKKCA